MLATAISIDKQLLTQLFREAVGHMFPVSKSGHNFVIGRLPGSVRSTPETRSRVESELAKHVKDGLVVIDNDFYRPGPKLDFKPSSVELTPDEHKLLCGSGSKTRQTPEKLMKQPPSARA